MKNSLAVVLMGVKAASPVAELKRTVPVPALQEPDVELFVQVPLNSQPVVPPKEKKPPELIVTLLVTVLAPDAPEEMPPSREANVVMVTTLVLSANVLPLETVRVAATFRSLFSVVVPPEVMVSESKSLSVESNAMVEPFTVTVLVPWVKVEPAPELFHVPLTVTAADVRVRVPDVPLVIVKLFIVLAMVLMVTRPALPIVREPAVPPVRPVLAADASRVVVDEVSETVSVPPQRSVRVAIVKVIAEPDPD